MRERANSVLPVVFLFQSRTGTFRDMCLLVGLGSWGWDNVEEY